MGEPFTDAELDAMKAVATKATQGKWRHYRARLRPQFKQMINEVQIDGQSPIVPWIGFDDSDRAKQKQAANAAHIAAFDPPTVLRLLAELKAARRKP